MQLSVFSYQSEQEHQFNDIRTVEIEGEVWFVAADACKILGLTNPSKAVSALDDDEKNTLTISDGTSGNPNMTIVSESGLYALIFKSRKPSANKFRKWITKEVIPSIRKQGYYGKIDRRDLPNFYIRYRDNFHKLDRNYFSVISELFVTLYLELEKHGYQIPDKGIDDKGIYPDISVGKMFSSYLKKVDSEFQDQFKTYKHSFPDDRSDVEARMYPLEALPVFRKFVYDKWIPERAKDYFSQKDPSAIDYLPKLLGN